MNTDPHPIGSGPGCGCSTGATTVAPAHRGLARRDFLRLVGASGVAAFTFRPLEVAMAGPFTAADFEQLVPTDKKLNAAWVRSLVERGKPELWRGAELAHIGLPIGGICAGQLYLGGDGELWHWDIFKSNYSSDYGGMSMGLHYANPAKVDSRVEQGFALKVRTDGQSHERALSARGFSDVTFRGEYPLARIQYRDAGCPVTADLEAFSPFMPLDAESSSLPATVLEFTVKNTGTSPVEVDLAGWLQNAVCPDCESPALGRRRNRVRRSSGAITLECSAEPAPARQSAEQRPDLVFEDFERETYEGWSTGGTAFGNGPVAIDTLPGYQGEVGGAGQRVINSHASAPGNDSVGRDSAVGTLQSRPFPVSRDFITFLIGGGNHPRRTCLNLLVDDQLVSTATGFGENRLRPGFFDVSQFAGQTARLEIVDAVAGAWGNIGVDQIVFTDELPGNLRLEELPGFGTMALSLLSPVEPDAAVALVPGEVAPGAVFAAFASEPPAETVSIPFGQMAVGALKRTLSLPPGETGTATFVLTWCFPDYVNARGEMAGAVAGLGKLRRHYAKRFQSATAVANHVAAHFESLAAQTRLWNRTWYDSTLPYWLLDRTFITLNTLATQTCHWFDSGRFYGWEGVDCCPGTCQHVWQYAQGMARIFPELERGVRQRVDFGSAWHENGAIDYRGEAGRSVAHDGFAGTILRVYREHQMSADEKLLHQLWPRIRRSVEYLMAEDRDGDGLLEGKQYNTLDAAWYGPMGWISSLYLAALQAGRAMALEMGDPEFARRCEERVAAGRRNIVAQLYNGEYFIHKPDPNHPEATNTNTGCHIDQVFGQSFAWQLGLDRVVPAPETRSALQSLWKYSFTPDVGSYRKNFTAIKTGRWYAMPGEGGLLMCTWPRGGAEMAPGGGNRTFIGYFNECMTGFEYQVASHMIWEGSPGSDLVEKGLAITRMIHDRYHAAKRNPYNEIECSDHYSRAMASYGVFLAACGYEYHGPKQHIGFAPKLSPENFKAPFTAAEGWGTFAQQRTANSQSHQIEVKHGQLRIGTLAIQLAPNAELRSVTAQNGSKTIGAQARQEGTRVDVTFGETVLVNKAGERLEILVALST